MSLCCDSINVNQAPAVGHIVGVGGTEICSILLMGGVGVTLRMNKR